MDLDEALTTIAAAIEQGELEPNDETLALVQAAADVKRTRPEPVTASAEPKPTRVAAQRPAVTKPAPTPPRGAVTASGAPVTDLAAVMADAIERSRRQPTQLGGDELVATLYVADAVPRLTTDREANAALVASAQRALVASGGICTPLPVWYESGGGVVATAARPIRDALPRFVANRGGVQLPTSPQFGDASGGVAVWTHANDVTPASPATKPVKIIECPEYSEVRVDAVTMRMQGGNFAYRFAQEAVQDWLTVLAVDHAALAETQLLAKIDAGSKAVTSGQVLSATRDVLATIDRAAAAMRSRWRMSASYPMTLIAPSWLRDMLRTDLAREMPGAPSERLAVADAQLTQMLAVRDVSVIWSLDVQRFGTQGVGSLIGWPDTVTLRLFPAGTWLFLDGGRLDLGVLRDATLNQTNQWEMFAETFENIAMVGVESLKITADVVADGATAAAVSTIDLSYSGS